MIKKKWKSAKTIWRMKFRSRWGVPPSRPPLLREISVQPWEKWEGSYVALLSHFPSLVVQSAISESGGARIQTRHKPPSLLRALGERERESFSPPYSLPLFSLIFSLLHPAASLCVFGGGFRRRRTTNTFTKVGGVVIGRETTPSCVQVRRKKEKNNNQEDCVCVSFRTTHQLPLFFFVRSRESGGWWWWW